MNNSLMSRDRYFWMITKRKGFYRLLKNGSHCGIRILEYLCNSDIIYYLDNFLSKCENVGLKWNYYIHGKKQTHSKEFFKWKGPVKVKQTIICPLNYRLVFIDTLSLGIRYDIEIYV